MTLRIATFNLENLDDQPADGLPFSKRIEVLRPQLMRLRADVLCLQEVNGRRLEKAADRTLPALDELLRTTPYAGFHSGTTHAPGRKGVADKHNLVILSRWPILHISQHKNDKLTAPLHGYLTAEPPTERPDEITWDRPILQCEIALPDNRCLHVMNLHLRAPLAAPVPGQKTGAFQWKSVGGWAEGFYLAGLKRAGQALEARLLVEDIFDKEENALVAVCGDFNAEARETPLRLIRGDLEDTGNGNLSGRMLVPLERTLPETQRFSVLHSGHRLMLDHIMVSRALLAHYRHVEVHNEALGDEFIAYATVSHSPESYHAPVVAEFEIPGDAEVASKE